MVRALIGPAAIPGEPKTETWFLARRAPDPRIHGALLIAAGAREQRPSITCCEHGGLCEVMVAPSREPHEDPTPEQAIGGSE